MIVGLCLGYILDRAVLGWSLMIVQWSEACVYFELSGFGWPLMIVIMSSRTWSLALTEFSVVGMIISDTDIVAWRGGCGW